jgi:hypothetical protein
MLIAIICRSLHKEFNLLQLPKNIIRRKQAVQYIIRLQTEGFKKPPRINGGVEGNLCVNPIEVISVGKQLTTQGDRP